MKTAIWLLCAFISISVAQSRLTRQTSQTVEFEFTLPPVRMEPAGGSADKRYTNIIYDGNRSLIRPGAPLIPYTLERVGVPPGAKVTVRYRILEQQVLEGIDLPPLTEISAARRERFIPKDESVYEGGQRYPRQTVSVSQPYGYRKLNVVDVSIFPVQYEPASRRVVLIKRISVQLRFQGTSLSGLGPGLNASDQSFLQNKILNLAQARFWTVPKPSFLKVQQTNYDFSVGQWYEIPVQEEGVYRLTGSFLKGRGVDLAAIDPSTIQMFNYGGAPLSPNINAPRPADLNEIAIEVEDVNQDGAFGENDAILFYGRGPDTWRYNSARGGWVSQHNPYATTNYYLLTFNQHPGKRLREKTSLNSPGAPVFNSFQEHLRFEKDIYNILQSGPDWYWIRLIQGSADQANIKFQAPGNVVPGPIQLFFFFKGESGSRFGDNKSYRDSIRISLNGQRILDNLVIFRNQWRSATFSQADAPPLKSGENEILLRMSANLEASSALMDYFVLKYQRQFTAENNFLKFNGNIDVTPREFRIDGFSGGTPRVWDITDFANVRKIIPSQADNSVVFQDTSAVARVREYMAFTPDAVRDIDQLILLENRPNLRSTDRQAQLIIITPDAFYNAAEALETLRETQQPNPIQTERIRVSDIFREFSSGVPDPTAIRDFLAWAYYNWSTPPDYVMLLGDASYDYKHIELKDYINRIPLFQIAGAEELSSRETDHYYVAFGNTAPAVPPDHLTPYPSFFNLDPWLPLGRVPINSGAELQSFIDKEISYQNSFLINPGENGWQSVLTFVADDQFGPVGFNNEWFHLLDTEDVIRRDIPLKFDLSKIYLTDFDTQAGGLGRVKPGATEALLDQVNNGTLLINYFGHGDPDTWAHESVLTRSRDLSKIQNPGRLPFWVAATCDWGKFDDPNHNSMAEEMIWQSNRGGISVLSSSRPVFASANAAFVRAFYKHLFNSRSETQRSSLVGDALVQSLGGGVNDQKYRLLGDPTLRLADPQYQIKIDSISPDTLKALSTVSISATVLDNNGAPLTNFQGEALIRVFDAKDSLTANNQTIRYQYQKNLIFKGIVSVQGGQVQSQFIVPKSIKYRDAKSGRISIYAWSETSRDAVGFVDSLLFLGTRKQVSDRQGPEIDFSFKEQPDFFDGDFVSGQPTIEVRITDENGINLTQEVGHRIELILDDQTRKDLTRFFVYDKNSFRAGRLEYTLPALPPGVHRLRFTAWDNLNNRSEKEISFRTAVANKLVLDEVMNFPNPFADDTNFTFQFQSPNNSGEVRIRIYTVTGRLIQELEGLAQPGFNRIYWDGRDRDGDLLANGVYLYKIIVDDGSQRIEKLEKLAIVR